jgi:hypothetical protein
LVGTVKEPEPPWVLVLAQQSPPSKEQGAVLQAGSHQPSPRRAGLHVAEQPEMAMGW